MLGHDTLYWVLPITAAAVWTVTLGFMLAYWLGQKRPRLPLMVATQELPYISDIGAGKTKLLFVAGSVVFVILWLSTLLVEQDLRAQARLAPHKTELQDHLARIAIILACFGGLSLILLAIVDVEQARAVHLSFLGVFVLSSLAALTVLCAYYWTLSQSYPKRSILRTSFWIKVVLVGIGGTLAIGFGITNVMNRRSNLSSILEWLVALFFILFVLSYAIDLHP